jgi:myo-inositol 2-dehydrogenase/D-chiro-inositol 1-dehydrogenase
MGADHARTLAGRVAGAELTALFDPEAERVRAVAEETGARHVLTGAEALIAHPEVDAVLVASPDHTHRQLVAGCLRARKPVLSEKPLAPTAAECFEVVAEEAALGRRLVQVGFMRRFDPAYMAMKQTFGRGELGRPLFFHSAHRNASAPPWFVSEMVITNSAVHDIDIARWLLEDEFVRAKVFAPGQANAGALRDPQFLVLETAGGTLVNVEVFVNAGYGYDIRGELVCEHGSVTLSPQNHVHVRQGGTEAFGFAPDWRPRFAAAYHNELQGWVNAIRGGGPCGASAWDGYVATAVAEACLRSLGDGPEVEITLERRPPLYEH